MKIARYNHFNKVTKTISEGQEAKDSYLILQDSDSVPANYTDISGESDEIEQVSDNGEMLISQSVSGWYDKLCVREHIKSLVYAKMGVASEADLEDDTKWNLLNPVQKGIAARWFIVGKESFQLEVENDDRYWTIEGKKYRRWTKKDRETRLEIMESIVFRRVQDIKDSMSIMDDLNQIMKETEGFVFDTSLSTAGTAAKLEGKVKIKPLTKQYIDGIKSKSDDNIVALRDFINSEAGTPFALEGFRNYGYTFRSGHTATSVADELLKVIDSIW